ncbi:hypothetical protein F4808DRAFT_441548 [Astrocystis sublimbata]|nr:hypothetical protein F4808DRAFT_441548 [Astrocystis sublimbata]
MRNQGLFFYREVIIGVLASHLTAYLVCSRPYNYPVCASPVECSTIGQPLADFIFLTTLYIVSVLHLPPL